MTLDHPFVRRSTQCVLCNGVKDCGTLTCWTCYRVHGLRYGNRAAEGVIDGAERHHALAVTLENTYRNMTATRH